MSDATTPEDPNANDEHAECRYEIHYLKERVKFLESHAEAEINRLQTIVNTQNDVIDWYDGDRHIDFDRYVIPEDLRDLKRRLDAAEAAREKR